MVRTLSDFVNSALNKCSLSLEHETDQCTLEYMVRTLSDFVNSALNKCSLSLGV